MQKMIEKTLFASRWILAPVYLGLSLALLADVVRDHSPHLRALGGVDGGAGQDRVRVPP